ncbi:MAG: FAD-dependent oxidoreductase [Elusimicrobiota bacterium]|nr:FAD-dependent oxidoreductase [Elusimicrobiota bacterium]
MSAVHPTFEPALLSARDLAAGVRLFRFASPPGFSFVPGQFLMFHFADDPKTWRAYSVCSAPQAATHYFEVAVGMVGAFSERLGALAPGGARGLVCRGPFGKWTWAGEGHAVLVAGGTGVTPFRAMVLHGRGRVTVCCSAKTPETLLFADEFPAWEKAGAKVHARVTQAAWSGATGRWTADAVVAAAADPDATYFLCGSKSLVTDMKTGLLAAGVAPAKVRTENWGDYSDLF